MSIEFFERDPSSGLVSAIPFFERVTFPAGEQHIKLRSPLSSDQIAFVRGTDANDFIALALWADMVQSEGCKTYAAIPYLPGARADKGVPFGARYYADLINTAPLDEVVCLDPHSPVMPNLTTPRPEGRGFPRSPAGVPVSQPTAERMTLAD